MTQITQAMIDEVEAKAEAERRTPRGPDYHRIICEVAKSYGVDANDLDQAHVNWLTALASTG